MCRRRNGRVGIIGICYDGFEPLMALVNPHPALKVSVPMNPMVDGWRGDDWFHNGAFRQLDMDYICEQEATARQQRALVTSNSYDDYDSFLRAGSAGELGRQHGMDQIGFWQQDHRSTRPTTASGRDQAMDRILAGQPLKVPVMLVDSLWDAEDIYGAPAVYRALEPKDAGNDMVYLVARALVSRPGDRRGQQHSARSSSTSDTAQMVAPAGACAVPRPLSEGRRPMDVAPVTAFQTGTNDGSASNAWPPRARRSDAAVSASPAWRSASTPAPARRRPPIMSSDPAHPGHLRAAARSRRRAIEDDHWKAWLTTDQRDVSARPDVLTFTDRRADRAGDRSPASRSST